MLTGNDFDPADEEKSETQPLLPPLVVEPVSQTVITIDKPYEKLLNLPQDVWFTILQFVDLESFSLLTLSSQFSAALKISIPNQKKFHELKHLGFLSNLNSVFDHLRPMMEEAETKATAVEEVRFKPKRKVGVLFALSVCAVVTWQGDYRFFQFLLGERSTYNEAASKALSTFNTLYDRCDDVRHSDCSGGCAYENTYCGNPYLIDALKRCDAGLYAIYAAVCDTKEGSDHYARNIFLAFLIIVFTLLFYLVMIGGFSNRLNWFKQPKVDKLIPVLPLLTDERLSAVDRYILHFYELTDEKNTIKFGEIRLRVDKLKAQMRALYERLIAQLKENPTVVELECKVMFLQVLERVIALANIEAADKKALSPENKIILFDAKKETFFQQQMTSAQNTLALLQDEKNTLNEIQIEATSDLLSLVAPEYNERAKRNEVDSCSMTLFRQRQTLFSVQAQRAVIDKLQPQSNVLPVGLFAGKRSQPRVISKDQVEQKQVNVGAAAPAVLN